MFDLVFVYLAHIFTFIYCKLFYLQMWRWTPEAEAVCQTLKLSSACLRIVIIRKESQAKNNHQEFSSHEPDTEVTPELSEPEDRVMVELEAREGSEELTDDREGGRGTYLWASSSHSQEVIMICS